MSTTAASTAAATNLATVKSVYEAFGRGDVPAILDMLADDVVWDNVGDSFAQRAGVDYLMPRAGRDGVAEFFGAVGALEISEFTVGDLMASDKHVAAEIVIDAKVPSGGRLRDEEMHLWTFNDAGKITSMRHYVDTAKHIAAADGEDTTT